MLFFQNNTIFKYTTCVRISKLFCNRGGRGRHGDGSSPAFPCLRKKSLRGQTHVRPRRDQIYGKEK